ncbi:MAG: hypothetical protein COB66_06265 [Coxiella sp. (in: Bacteria)]|nr:MAG: hypothetical protein COB66_06265 [Coxiella sp. (in: g-proteobacteria)]
MTKDALIRPILCCCLMALMALVMVNAHAAKKKKRVHYREETYYVPEKMFVCSVYNRSSGVTYYGKSPKEKYAQTYARTSCQMRSYEGQCYVRTRCNLEMVQVRKRRYIRS